MSEVKVNKISPRTNCGTVTVGDSGDSVSVSAGVPVTVNGDLKSNALKATDGGSIISQSGTNITIGASGDTVSLASGASQSGFGRTGTVDWQTGSIKTSGFTATNGEGYFCNTTSAAFTMTLPASPSAGDIVAVKDYANTFDTNNLTVGRNSSNIGGEAADSILSAEGTSVTFVYVDATKGWLVIQEGAQSDAPQPLFTTATGGTETTCGDYKIHTFTSPGTFTVSQVGNSPTVPSGGPAVVDYMVVAGAGGGGGSTAGSNRGAGGGGAGGWRASSGTASGCYTAGPSPLTSPVSGITVTATAFPITVGGGGAGGPAGSQNPGAGGSNSVFSTITSALGAGGGASANATGDRNGANGGSGGGGGGGSGSGGSGNSPPVSPPQGNNGGNSPGPDAGAGGGGSSSAGVNGANGCSVRGGHGGCGVTSCITASPVAYAGGGGGAAGNNGCTGQGRAGGGNGGRNNPGPFGGGTGTANTGSGGGGGAGSGGDGGNGGSGVVVLRYKFQ
jgi:hypothetical protein